MAQSIAIVAPFNWFPVLDRDAKPTLDTEQTVTLMLANDGPVIIGKDSRDDYDPTYIAFALAGLGVEAQDQHRAMRFEEWSAELCHEARPFLSLGTLLEVNT